MTNWAEKKCLKLFDQVRDQDHLLIVSFSRVQNVKQNEEMKQKAVKQNAVGTVFFFTSVQIWGGLCWKAGISNWLKVRTSFPNLFCSKFLSQRKSMKFHFCLAFDIFQQNEDHLENNKEILNKKSMDNEQTFSWHLYALGPYFK